MKPVPSPVRSQDADSEELSLFEGEGLPSDCG
jgi:hypothetical protein